jgi:hypothetical protein
VTWRIGYTAVSPGVFDILVTPNYSRYGSYTATTNSVKVRGDLTSAPIPLATSYRCTGTCARGFYTGTDSYGWRPTAKYVNGSNEFLFYADNNLKTLVWDKNMVGTNNFYATSPNLIWGMAVNSSKKRLYVTTQDVLTQQYKLLVFNINPVLSNAAPTLVSSITIYDGVPQNIDAQPTDVIVNEAASKVYVYLAGTGGIAILNDPGTGTPNAGDVSFVGVETLASSQSDVVNSGRKLALDSINNLLVGISRSGRQIFTVDLVTLEVNSVATDFKADAIATVPEANLVVIVDRTKSNVYIVK